MVNYHALSNNLLTKMASWEGLQFYNDWVAYIKTPILLRKTNKLNKNNLKNHLMKGTGTDQSGFILKLDILKEKTVT